MDIKGEVTKLIHEYQNFPADDEFERFIYRDGDAVCFHQRLNDTTCSSASAGGMLGLWGDAFKEANRLAKELYDASTREWDKYREQGGCDCSECVKAFTRTCGEEI